MLEAEDLIEGSHDYKAAVALFDTFPKDELFAAPIDDLRRAVVALLALEGTDRVRLLGRRAPDGRSASFIVALPRDALRRRAAGRARCASCSARASSTDDVESQHVLGEGDRVQVHFLVHAPDGLPDVDIRELEREVVALARTWDDELRDALVERRRRARRGCWPSWAPRLPAHYKGYTTPALAAHDIALLRAAGRAASRSSSALQNERGEAGTHARRALQARRQGRAVATRCRCSRTSACA